MTNCSECRISQQFICVQLYISLHVLSYAIIKTRGVFFFFFAFFLIFPYFKFPFIYSFIMVSFSIYPYIMVSFHSFIYHGFIFSNFHVSFQFHSFIYHGFIFICFHISFQVHLMHLSWFHFVIFPCCISCIHSSWFHSCSSFFSFWIVHACTRSIFIFNFGVGYQER